MLKIIVSHSYSKEVSNDINFIAYTSYFVDKINGQSFSGNTQ
jgi:hypothetical protein